MAINKGDIQSINGPCENDTDILVSDTAWQVVKCIADQALYNSKNDFPVFSLLMKNNVIYSAEDIVRIFSLLVRNIKWEPIYLNDDDIIILKYFMDLESSLLKLLLQEALSCIQDKPDNFLHEYFFKNWDISLDNLQASMNNFTWQARENRTFINTIDEEVAWRLDPLVAPQFDDNGSCIVPYKSLPGSAMSPSHCMPWFLHLYKKNGQILVGGYFLWKEEPQFDKNNIAIYPWLSNMCMVLRKKWNQLYQLESDQNQQYINIKGDRYKFGKFWSYKSIEDMTWEPLRQIEEIS